MHTVAPKAFGQQTTQMYLIDITILPQLIDYIKNFKQYFALEVFRNGV